MGLRDGGVPPQHFDKLSAGLTFSLMEKGLGGRTGVGWGGTVLVWWLDLFDLVG